MILFEPIFFISAIKRQGSDKREIEQLRKLFADTKRMSIWHGNDRIGRRPFELNPLEKRKTGKRNRRVKTQKSGGRFWIENKGAHCRKDLSFQTLSAKPPLSVELFKAMAAPFDRIG